MAAKDFLAAIRRRKSVGVDKDVTAQAAAVRHNPQRLAGTNPNTLVSVQPNPPDGALGSDNPNGRMGNDWLYPDNPRGRFDVGTVNGHRKQNMTSRHIHEGEAPGRIPRGWNSRIHGKVGANSGTPYGNDNPGITITGEQGGGEGEMKYIPHTPTPRGVGIARTYLRTVDDAAPIPGIFLSDPTRH